MFKRLTWKITARVLLAVLLAVLVTGGISFYHVLDLQRSEFRTAAESVENSDLPAFLGQILTSGEEAAIMLPQAEGAVNAYAGTLGISENRSYFLLSSRDAAVIAPVSMRGSTVTMTENLSHAMRGGKGDKVSLFGDVMDYAIFIRNGSEVEDGFILYVRDNKVGVHAVLVETAIRLLWAMLAGLVLAFGAGILISRSLMKPLYLVRQRMEQFTRGDFSPALDAVPPGEMGDLVRSFNRIGTVMNDSINQINAEKHKIEVILERIDSGIIAFDTEQKVIHINPAAKRMFDIEVPEELRFDRFFRKLGADVCMAEFMYLEGARAEEQELLLNQSHIKTNLVPFKIDEERIAGVICVFEDVTEQFNLETARQKFVAEVSHELKTPLTTIRTYTETLLNGYLDDKKTAVGFLQTVENEVDKMVLLVQNLLILNRFDMQRVDAEKIHFSIDDMLRSLSDMFRVEAEKKGLTLTYNRTTEIAEIYADPDQIERAIKNIISNSIKYCARGDKIQIFAGTLYNNVYVKVEDSGKGIPKSDLEHVFERFYRVDKARSRDKGGTGLGLSITKEIIESHGGTIQIESEFGRFTRVTVNLPMAEK
ncbi:HAMP domain-containing protein [Methanocorpusculum sp.]|nr:HAMP domain-containing protein [Methanocorpusculum sp.]